jgi:Signal transduction histidine kinase regulating citrate/malate metabolism
MNYSALFVPVVTLLTAQITVLDLAKFRFHKKKLLLIITLEFILQVSLNAAVLLLDGLQYYGRWYFVTMDIPAILIFYYCSRRRDFRDLFTVLITIFISFAISIPSMGIQKYLGYGYWLYNLLRILIFTGVFFVLHCFVRRRYLQLQEEIEKGWGVFCILPVIGTLLLYYEYLQYSIDGNFLGVLRSCSLIVTIMAVVFCVFNYILTELHEKYIVLEQRRILTMQNKAQRDQFEQQREAAEKTNRRFHDLRHNILMLIELLEAGDTKTALTYLKEQQGMEEIAKEEYCSHPAVNSILYFWAAKARRADCHVEIHTDVPEQLRIDPMELSALFANAFENAYEGCLRLPESIPRFIKVEANYNGKRLAIGFTNSCSENICFEGDYPVSSKEDGGIGTRSMDFTVKRYRGTSCFEAKEGVFYARFVLNV